MTNSKEIEIRIKSVEQLFNSFDPAPFRERELDREAERHIVSYAREIDAGSPVDLVIYLPPATIGPTLAEELAAAIGNHFELRAREQEIELNELRRLGRKGLVVGLLVMLFATLAGIALTNAFPKSSFFETIEQSLIIFAWVALWRPAEILLYDRWPLIRERELFQWLATAPVIVRAGVTDVRPA
ncbi:MAG: hypothetical protein WCD32_00265 [Azonexus sp.]|jgi:hypothetical protein